MCETIGVLLALIIDQVMSTFLTERMGSASPTRSLRRTRSYAGDFRRNQRSVANTEKHSNNRRPLELIDLPGVKDSQKQRPKTVANSRTRTARSSLKHLHSDEIEKLLRSSDSDERSLAQVDCLADYRTLIQAIDLRATPFSSQLLCSLQQRENRIVQRNACRDTRFCLLMDSLQPSYRVTPENKSVLSLQNLHQIGVM